MSHKNTRSGKKYPKLAPFNLTEFQKQATPPPIPAHDYNGARGGKVPGIPKRNRKTEEIKT